MRLRRIVRPNQPRLILPARVLRLAEREPAIPSHALDGADLLDCFLEPEEYADQYAIEDGTHDHSLFLSRSIVGNIILL